MTDFGEAARDRPYHGVLNKPLTGCNACWYGLPTFTENGKRFGERVWRLVNGVKQTRCEECKSGILQFVDAKQNARRMEESVHDDY
jgi:hypothetical protein